MPFSKSELIKLEEAYAEIDNIFESLLVTYCMRRYASSHAKEFALHGFARRMKTMKRCIDNIYRICPPHNERKLASDNLNDLVINLQAFVLNVYGCLDNLAWVWSKESGLVNKKGGQLKNGEVGLTKKYDLVRKSFSLGFQNYLNSLDNWFLHIEEFRHALAHRIPLYVPPYVSNEGEVRKENDLETLRQTALKMHNFEEYERITSEIEALGRFEPFMTHSFSEKSPYVVFHAQIIADWKTVVQISENFLNELDGLKNIS